jgi:hypothetical protein
VEEVVAAHIGPAGGLDHDGFTVGAHAEQGLGWFHAGVPNMLVFSLAR